MSVQLKFKDDTSGERRHEIVKALARAGFAARSLFPGQTRPKLASIYTISDAEAEHLSEIHSALADYRGDIEFVEQAPERKPKA
jgi:hypothetical protein